MKKVLITGFEPFQNEVLNPSQKLIETYTSQRSLTTLLLPVSYQRAWQALGDHLRNENYDFILMLGQAGGRKWISLEKFAVNLEDTEKADEDGDLRLQKKISLEGPDAFLNPLPLRDWAQELQTKKLPVEVSFTAGAFVCNSIYYQAFEFVKSQGCETQLLFVHVPFTREQVLGKAEENPFLPIEVMKKTIDELLTLLWPRSAQ